MIYKRPSSINITVNEYVKKFGSVEKAKNHFFNIGAGSWFHPCWTNIDLPAQSPEFASIQAPCIHHDLVKDSRLPIMSDTVENFYCSHVVEHIPDYANKNLFSEVYRCLKKGGVFRISTGPCADLDWDAMERLDNDWWYFYDDEDFQKTFKKGLNPMTPYDKWLFHVATPKSIYSQTKCSLKYTSDDIRELIIVSKNQPTELLNNLTSDLVFNINSPGDHICWWNFEKLKQYLTMAGFTNIYRSGYGQSKEVWMRDLMYFDQTYPQISVYIEARK